MVYFIILRIYFYIIGHYIWPLIIRTCHFLFVVNNDFKMHPTFTSVGITLIAISFAMVQLAATMGHLPLKVRLRFAFKTTKHKILLLLHAILLVFLLIADFNGYSQLGMLSVLILIVIIIVYIFLCYKWLKINPWLNDTWNELAKFTEKRISNEISLNESKKEFSKQFYKQDSTFVRHHKLIKRLIYVPVRRIDLNMVLTAKVDVSSGIVEKIDLQKINKKIKDWKLENCDSFEVVIDAAPGDLIDIWDKEALRCRQGITLNVIFPHYDIFLKKINTTELKIENENNENTNEENKIKAFLREMLKEIGQDIIITTKLPETTALDDYFEIIRTAKEIEKEKLLADFIDSVIKFPKTVCHQCKSMTLSLFLDKTLDNFKDTFPFVSKRTFIQSLFNKNFYEYGCNCANTKKLEILDFLCRFMEIILKEYTRNLKEPIEDEPLQLIERFANSFWTGFTFNKKITKQLIKEASNIYAKYCERIFWFCIYSIKPDNEKLRLINATRKMCVSFSNTLRYLEVQGNCNIEFKKSFWKTRLNIVFDAYDAFRGEYLSSNCMRKQILPFAIMFDSLDNYHWAEAISEFCSIDGMVAEKPEYDSHILGETWTRGRTSRKQLWLLLTLYCATLEKGQDLIELFRSRLNNKFKTPDSIEECVYRLVSKDLHRILLSGLESETEIEKKIEKAIYDVKNLLKKIKKGETPVST